MLCNCDKHSSFKTPLRFSVCLLCFIKVCIDVWPRKHLWQTCINISGCEWTFLHLSRHRALRHLLRRAVMIEITVWVQKEFLKWIDTTNTYSHVCKARECKTKVRNVKDRIEQLAASPPEPGSIALPLPWRQKWYLGVKGVADAW